MPLHGVINAERVIAVALLIFYIHQFFSEEKNIKSKLEYSSLGLSVLVGLAAFIGIYQINFQEIFRLILIIWTVPFLKFCIDQYGTKKIIFLCLTILSIHGVWGISQFIFQKDFGLNYLGESHLSVEQNGVAKFLFQGQKIIRAYGLYAHPNIFSAAMLVGIILLLNSVWNENKKIFYFSFLIFLVALLTTFSRAAIIGLFIFLAINFFKKKNIKIIFLLTLICVTLFAPLYFYRTTDSEDRGVSERKSGAVWAMQIIKQNSWRGVGVGNYSEALKSYLEKNKIEYNKWEVQPVHSVPLLFFAEWGIVGLIVVSGGLVIALKQKKSELITLLIVLSPVILFDHYLATQTAPLVWVLLLAHLED